MIPWKKRVGSIFPWEQCLIEEYRKHHDQNICLKKQHLVLYIVIISDLGWQMLQIVEWEDIDLRLVMVVR